VLPTVYLSLGSNVGDRLANLDLAVERLESAGKILSKSSIYETEPVELTAQAWFLNLVVKLGTEKTPQQLLASILEIEQGMGRRRVQRKGPRVIDIDILLYEQQAIKAEGLMIPHPSMHTRRFVLAPLAEIDPTIEHPTLKRTVQELLDGLPSGQSVKLFGGSTSGSPS
jgi:2-amino-4-hydroxy-6-hydroxymethyldihydropteridine diphosphokinase